MQYNFDQDLQRRATDSIKWRMYGENVLPLWVADMDFASPQAVVEALRARVEHAVFGYPHEPPELRPLIVDWIWRRYQWQVQPEDLVFVPGVVVGFNMAAHALATPSGGVLIQTPVYPPMLSTAGYAGMQTQIHELTRQTDGSYAIDWDAFEAAMTDTTRMFLLCNPQNPSGRVFRRAELQRMAEICLRKGVVICSDEIHCDLVYSAHKHIPIASLDKEIARRTITLYAPSKTFNIAGLEFSLAVIPDPELRKRFEKARMGLVGHPNLLGGVAAMAAYRSGEEWLTQVLAYLQANRDYVYEYVNREMPQLHVNKPEGTYLAWIDCRDASLPGDAHEFFLKRAGVALMDGKIFGQGGEGFVRLNFGCQRATLTQALERMKQALTEKDK